MSRWEDLCLRCGLCCKEKVVTPEFLIIYDEMPCEFHDTETGLCRVYPERFRKCPRCEKVTVFKAMFAPYLPESCGYVRWARAHKVRYVRPRETVLAGKP